MHPNLAFRWEGREAMRALVSELGFGSLFAATPDGPRVVQVPMVWLDELEIAGWRGTVKLGQNKPEAARLAAAEGAEASGRRGIAHWMRSA